MGLTGGIATGKSAAAAILRRLGVPVIDADELARDVVRPGQEAWKEIVDIFGPSVLRGDRTLDRKKLRKIVFDDPAARKQLEAIVHPKVRALAEERIRDLEARGHEIIVYEVPLLFEGQLQLWLRPVILVACNLTTQKKRLKERDGLSDEEARQHLDAQMSLEEKRRLADYFIENNDTLEKLEQQVKTVLNKIRTT